MNEPVIKQVKVDNWGIFFLQRLQHFFSKCEHCDLILQFSNNERLKVHRLVLNACTEYFQTLEKHGSAVGECLIHMPKDLQPEVVVPIINFMYTGRLEFRTELHSRLYATAQQMNMTVLTKLLDAQSNASPPAPKPMVLKKMAQMPVTWTLQGKKILPKHIDPDLPEMLPGRKLPIWKRRVPSLPSYFSDTSAISNHERPYSRVTVSKADDVARPTRFDWPEEEFQPTSYTSTFDDISYESKPIVKPVELIKSVQLQLPTPSLTPPSTLRQESKVVSFEDIRRSVMSIKRPPVLSEEEFSESKKPRMMDLQAVKEYVEEHRLRKDLLDTEEESEDVDDDLAVADMDDDDDEDESEVLVGALSGPEPVKTLTHATVPTTVTQTITPRTITHTIAYTTPPHTITHTIPPQTLTHTLITPQTIARTIASHTLPPHTLPPQKSILKSQGAHEELPVPTPAIAPSKKVRFSAEAKSAEGKENESKVFRMDTGTNTAPSRISNMSVGSPANVGNLSNHAKIITEVLKKYPHLVKNNKNIRLKIMQRGGQPTLPTMATDMDGNKLVKSKVSYVVLKSEVGGKGKSAVVLKHGGHVEPLSELGGQKSASGAENTTGPWLCHSCGTNEEPINFGTYYEYRRHLQDVHMEKIDARICEHCGHRASKRNLLLYHLYTRHNVPPPRNCQFPKCDQCEYVALSESLLIKHRNNHSNNKEFVCKVCNAAFKSNGALQGHMQTNLHSDPAKKLYECPFCLKPFVRNINLKAHIRTAHKDLAKKLDEADAQLGQQHLNQQQLAQLRMSLHDPEDEPQIVNPDDPLANEEGEVMDVPVINALPQTKTEPGSVVLASRMTVLAEAPAVQSHVPSSEAEALSNVASGIAASLGLQDTLTGEQTVILLDENQEFILHTTEVVGEETAATEVQEYVEETAVGPDGQEYIVPEIMSNEEQSYPGPLSDLENYSGDNHSTSPATSSIESRALAASQPTAPPPIIIPEGEEIALVLSDHDYAEDLSHKENCGDRMMFIITQPMMEGGMMEQVIQTQEQDVHSLQEHVIHTQEQDVHSLQEHVIHTQNQEVLSLQEQVIHSHEQEVHSFQEHAIQSQEQEVHSLQEVIQSQEVHSLQEVIHSQEQEVHSLQEVIQSQEQEVHSLEEVIQSQEQEVHTLQEEHPIPQREVFTIPMKRQPEVNNVDVPATAMRSSVSEEVPMEVVEIIDVEENHVSPMDTLQQEDSQESDFCLQTNSEDIETSTVTTEEDAELEESGSFTVHKKNPVSSVAIRRLPLVQMAELVKEWDDFDDSSQDCNDSVSGTVVQGGVSRLDETMKPQAEDNASVSLASGSRISGAALE